MSDFVAGFGQALIVGLVFAGPALLVVWWQT